MKFRKLLATIMVFSMVFGLFGTAFAADNGSVDDGIIELLTSLGLVRGDDRGLRLDDTITRAEMMTILVRGFGQEDTAALLAGAPAFSDTADHWASGYIALAKNRGLTTGYPDGTFKPQANVTGAEALTMVARLVGLDVDDSVGWPDNYLNAAIEAGIVGADSPLVAAAGAAAIRGDVFTSFGVAGTSVPVTADGKNLFAAYVKIEPPTLTVDEVDPVTTADSITLSGSVDGAAMLLVGDGLVDFAADGSWSADVDLQVGANDIWVTALDVVGNEAAQVVKVERIPGEATGIRIDGPAQVTAGSTAEFVVAVHDANDAAIAGAEFEVDEVTGGAFDAATGIFTADTQVGSGSISVSYGEFSASIDVAVVAGPLTSIAISPSAPSIASGATQDFTVKGQDAHGNEVALDETATWTASSGVINAQGRFAAAEAGTVTITATVGDMTASTDATVFGAASAIKLSSPADLVANGKSTTTVTATIVDAQGNPVPTATNTVTLMSSNSARAAVKTASVAAVNGVATFELTAGNQSGSVILSASATGLTGTTANMTVNAQKLTSITVSADPQTVAADGASTSVLTYTQRDQAGETMITHQAITVTLTSSNTAIGTVPASIAFGAATATANVTAQNNVGSTTVTGTVQTAGWTDLAVPSITVNTTVVGAPYKLAVDSISSVAKAAGADSRNQAITVRVLDVNGNQVTNPSSVTVTIAVKGATTNTVDIKATSGALVADAAITGGGGATSVGQNNADFVTGRGKVTVYAKSTKAQTVTYEATGTFGATQLVAASTSGSYEAGPPAQITLTGSPRGLNGQVWLQADGASTGTITAKVSDANANPVQAGSVDITMEKTLNSSATQSFTKTTKTTVNGETSFTVTSTTTPTGAGDTFTATATGLSAGTITIYSAIIGVPNQLAISVPGTMTAGTAFKVTAEVRDAGGNMVFTDSGRAVSLEIKRAGSVVQTLSGATEGGQVVFDVTLTQAGAGNYDFTVTSTGLTQAAAANQTVGAGTATKLAISADVTTVGADGSSVVTITVKAQDAEGNDVGAGTNALTLKANTTAHGVWQTAGGATLTGTVGGIDTELAAGTFTTTDGTNSWAVNSTPGSTTITVEANGLQSASLTITSLMTGAANKLAIQPISQVSAGSNHSIKVWVLDANGNRVTTATNAITLTPTFNGVAAAPLNANAVKGEATFTYVNNNDAGTVSYEATSAGLTSASATGVIVPGSAAGVSLSFASNTLPADGSSVTTAIAEVVDANGNRVSDFSGTMTFSIASGRDFVDLLNESVTFTGGVASAQIRARTLVGTANIVASTTINNATQSDNANINTVAGLASASLSTATLADASQPVGQTTTLTVVLRDAYNHAITGKVGGDFTISFTNGAVASDSNFTDAGGGTYTWTITADASGTTDVRVTVDGVMLNNQPTFTVP